jgi:hypothetical protein
MLGRIKPRWPFHSFVGLYLGGVTPWRRDTFPAPFRRVFLACLLTVGLAAKIGTR